MPNKLNQGLFIIAVLLSLVIVTFDKPSRFKSSPLVSFSDYAPTITAKPRSFLRVDLKYIQLAQKHDGVSILRGRILSQIPISDPIKVRWNLPESVHIVSGSQESEVVISNAGTEVEISVTGFSMEDQDNISLQVSTEMGGVSIGHTATLASNPELTNEFQVSQARTDLIRARSEKIRSLGGESRTPSSTNAKNENIIF